MLLKDITNICVYMGKNIIKSRESHTHGYIAVTSCPIFFAEYLVPLLKEIFMQFEKLILLRKKKIYNYNNEIQIYNSQHKLTLCKSFENLEGINF